MIDGLPVAHVDDAALVTAVAAGSEDALAELYDRYGTALFGTAFRLTGDRQAAEDVVQEVFLTLWNRAEHYDPQIASLAAWLGTITRHRAIDRLRAAGRRPRLVSLGGPDDDPSAAIDLLERAAAERVDTSAFDAADPASVLDASEARAAINAALGDMPEQEREVIVLAYRDELTQREIASRLGWPLGTVKTRTRRALAHLRLALAGVYGPALGPVALAELSDEPARSPGPRDMGGRA